MLKIERNNSFDDVIKSFLSSVALVNFRKTTNDKIFVIAKTIKESAR